MARSRNHVLTEPGRPCDAPLMRRVGRRRVLLAAGALALASLAQARASRRVPRLGVLYPNPTYSEASGGSALALYASALKDFGWIVGENLELVNASAEGREERLPALAASLVEKQVDVIWTAGPEAAIAAARATTTIPIAFYGVGYPVEQGLVDSLAKPGRNVTGLASMAGSEWSKAVEALREISPGLRKLAWIRVETVARSVSGAEVRVHDRRFESDALAQGLEVRKFPVYKAEDFDGAFAAISAAGAEGLFCDFTALTIRERQRIADFANRHRLPSAFGAEPYVRAGGLLSYGANRGWMTRRSFVYVDRILRGARPPDLPVEAPTRFQLAVNLKTARLLGLTIPQSLLLRADRIIE